MAGTLETNLQDAGELDTCERCNRTFGKGWSFAFKKPVPVGSPDEGVIIKCSRCAFRHRPMLRRSLLVAVGVGTILTALKHGDIPHARAWNGTLDWKIP